MLDIFKNKSEETTKLPDKILIVDKQLENDIKYLPDHHNMAKDFELIDIDSIKECKDIEVFKNKNLIPLKDYKKGHLVRSELYLNRYYPLFDYAENFYEYLAGILQNLSSAMGATGFELVQTKEEKNKKEESDGIGGGIEADYNAPQGGGGGGIGGNSQTSNIKENANAKGLKTTMQTHKPNKLSPKELDKYIENKGINLYALPPTFQSLIDDYKNGASLKSYTLEKYEESSIKTYQSICKEFSANVKIMNIFKAEFGLKIDKENISYKEMKKQLSVNIYFAEE